MRTTWQHHKATTRELRGYAFRTRIDPQLGALRLDAITPDVAASWLGGLVSSKGATRVVQDAHALLAQMLAQAVTLQVIPFSPMHAVPFPVHLVDRSERRVLTLDEYRRLLTGCRSLHDRTLIRMMCEAGLRRGEMLGLRWGDLQLARNLVIVKRRVYEMRDGSRDIDTPKSGRPRPVGVPESLAWELRWLRERRHYPADELPVWVRITRYTGGEPMALTGSSLVKTIHRVAQAAGLTTPGSQWITPHVLRASGATIAALAGVNPYLIQQQLGHANFDTTQHYLRPDRSTALEGYGAWFE